MSGPETLSTIAALSNLRSQAMDRSDAVDRLSYTGEQQLAAQLSASRCWSRQCDGLATAILAEPPATASDMRSLMLVVRQRFDEVFMTGEHAPSDPEVRASGEQLVVALDNLISALGSGMPALNTLEAADLRALNWHRRWRLPDAYPAEGGEP